MDELRRVDELTTADIANPNAVHEMEPAGDGLRARSGDGTAGRTMTEAGRDGMPEMRTSDLAAQAQTAGQRSSSGMTGGAADGREQHAAPLFPEDELHNFRARWDQVQTSFVDEPRKAVEQADSLVANVVKRIAEQFAAERAGLEKQWDRGDDVSTEDLRQGLRRYRAFFDRLLSV